MVYPASKTCPFLYDMYFRMYEMEENSCWTVHWLDRLFGWCCSSFFCNFSWNERNSIVYCGNVATDSFLWVCVCDSAMVSLHISERKMEHKKDGSSRNFYGGWDNFRSIYESDIDEISYWIIVKREFALGCKLSFF